MPFTPFASSTNQRHEPIRFKLLPWSSTWLISRKFAAPVRWVMLENTLMRLAYGRLKWVGRKAPGYVWNEKKTPTLRARKGVIVVCDEGGGHWWCLESYACMMFHRCQGGDNDSSSFNLDPMWRSAKPLNVLDLFVRISDGWLIKRFFRFLVL